MRTTRLVGFPDQVLRGLVQSVLVRVVDVLLDLHRGQVALDHVYDRQGGVASPDLSPRVVPAGTWARGISIAATTTGATQTRLVVGTVEAEEVREA